jgi:hypothetical protein
MTTRQFQSDVYFSIVKIADGLKSKLLTDTISSEEREVWKEFFNIGLNNLVEKPLKETKEYDLLVKTLILCLRQENTPKLVLDAAIALIEVGADKNLSRWDLIAFKQAKSELLKNGTISQRRLISIKNLEDGEISPSVIDQVRTGFGDANPQIRQRCIELISNLPMEYVEEVMKIIENDSKNKNYKVRHDVALVLKEWIKKLMPAPSKPPPARDPDALETDDDATEKALFRTFARGDPEQKKKLDKLNTNDPRMMDLYQRCIKTLLLLMTDDRKSDVSSLASSILAELKLGNAVFDWIVKLLESSDPIKRSDALKCLCFLKVAQKSNIPRIIQCFQDPYNTVRIQACRLACSLQCSEPIMIKSLLDLQEDPDYIVRSYAVKGW